MAAKKSLASTHSGLSRSAGKLSKEVPEAIPLSAPATPEGPPDNSSPAAVDLQVRAGESPQVPEPGLEPGRRRGDRGF